MSRVTLTVRAILQTQRTRGSGGDEKNVRGGRKGSGERRKEGRDGTSDASTPLVPLLLNPKVTKIEIASPMESTIVKEMSIRKALSIAIPRRPVDPVLSVWSMGRLSKVAVLCGTERDTGMREVAGKGTEGEIGITGGGDTPERTE